MDALQRYGVTIKQNRYKKIRPVVEMVIHMVLTEEDKQIILTFAECDMNATNAAKKLYFHRNSMVYRLNRIWNRTGLDPNKFYDLVKLVEISKKEG